MSFVLDASLALAWCFRDEAHEAALRVRDRLTTEEAIVPDVLWDLEIWNALIGACRRGRIRSVSANADLLAQLPVRRLTAPLNAVLPLADRRGLSSYDALYLALALQERLPLASLDGRLVASARAEGLEVLGRE